MHPTVRVKGFEVLLDAFATWEEEVFFLSLVGPREAVRAVLAAWVRGSEDLFIGGKRYPGRWRSERRFRVERLAGKHYHGIGWVPGHYYARKEDEKAERLWVSRTYGVPIPEEKGIWKDVRAHLLMEGHGVVALRDPSDYWESREIKRILSRLGKKAPAP